MNFKAGESLSKQLASLESRALAWFSEVESLWSSFSKEHGRYYDNDDMIEFYRNLPAEFIEKSEAIKSDMAEFSATLISQSQSSALASAADQGELRIYARRMISALDFKEYRFYEARLMSWEDQVYGVDPASQTESYVSPSSSIQIFTDTIEKVRRLLLFVKTSVSDHSVRQNAALASGSQSRPDSAFIMMWMSEEHPELEDVKIGIAEVFSEFGITAVRADEIEHEGIITERITQEIATAEFLIADLTGARPNVYYEVGYAHALGKRPILYRRKDAVLHFDLAGRNVPTYANVSDLKIKLRNRLEAMLGTQSPVSLKSKET